MTTSLWKTLYRIKVFKFDAAINLSHKILLRFAIINVGNLNVTKNKFSCRQSWCATGFAPNFLEFQRYQLFVPRLGPCYIKSVLLNTSQFTFEFSSDIWVSENLIEESVPTPGISLTVFLHCNINRKGNI